jgi:hypothetical protein
MVGVGEAASGPAEDRDLDLSESLYDIIPYSMGVWDRRVGVANVESAVNASPKMLRKIAVDES